MRLRTMVSPRRQGRRARRGEPGRSGALLTGRPSALASALTKVSGEIGAIPSKDLREQQALNAFFFAPAFTNRKSLASLFASHPPLEKRLEQLAKISTQLGSN